MCFNQDPRSSMSAVAQASSVRLSTKCARLGRPTPLSLESNTLSIWLSLPTEIYPSLTQTLSMPDASKLSAEMVVLDTQLRHLMMPSMLVRELNRSRKIYWSSWKSVVSSSFQLDTLTTSSSTWSRGRMRTIFHPTRQCAFGMLTSRVKSSSAQKCTSSSNSSNSSLWSPSLVEPPKVVWISHPARNRDQMLTVRMPTTSSINRMDTRTNSLHSSSKSTPKINCTSSSSKPLPNSSRWKEWLPCSSNRDWSRPTRNSSSSRSSNSRSYTHSSNNRRDMRSNSKSTQMLRPTRSRDNSSKDKAATRMAEDTENSLGTSSTGSEAVKQGKARTYIMRDDDLIWYLNRLSLSACLKIWTCIIKYRIQILV